MKILLETAPQVQTLLQEGAHVLCLLTDSRLWGNDSAVVLMYCSILDNLHAFGEYEGSAANKDSRPHTMMSSMNSTAPERKFNRGSFSLR